MCCCSIAPHASTWRTTSSGFAVGMAPIGAEIADVRDFDRVRHAVLGANQVYHFAAQVAVTCSMRIHSPILKLMPGGR